MTRYIPSFVRHLDAPARRPRVHFAVAVVLTALVACRAGPATNAPDEMTRFATLDSAAVPGRNLLWRAHACIQRMQVARSDTTYPAKDSLLRSDPACRALPFSQRSVDGWHLTYRRLDDTAGYELRANRKAPSARPISLYSRVLTHQINADAAMIHAREGDSLATLSDPVIGSPLPMLVWVGWCIEGNKTTRDTGIEGYLLHNRLLAPDDIGCLRTPPFRFTEDSNTVLVTANGMEYTVTYEAGPLEGESLNDPREDSRMDPILEWQYNTSYSMTATPTRYGETGLRSYHIEPTSGVARSWITRDLVRSFDMPPETPMCDWIRGTACGPARPNPHDGTFGPGLLTILNSREYKSH